MTTDTDRASKDWLGNLALLCAVTVACLGIAEFSVRTVIKDMALFPRYHAKADYGPVTLRRLRPNTVFWHTSPDGSWRFDINAQGYRDTEDWSYAKPAGTLRVLALGDSHTQGMESHQNDTYAEVLERTLIEHGLPAQVFNTGVSGFSTAEAYAFLKYEGIKYAPDIVVLGLFGNDFDDNVKAGLYSLENGKLVPGKTSHIPGVRILETINLFPPLRWLSENSQLYSLALNTVWETAKRMLLSRTEAALTTDLAVPSNNIDSYKKSLLSALVARLHAYCREQNISLIIADIPTFGSTGSRTFGSSIPADVLPSLRANSDTLLHSEDLFAAYRGKAEFHVQHGHRHISAFSHKILGEELARHIKVHLHK